MASGSGASEKSELQEYERKATSRLCMVLMKLRLWVILVCWSCAGCMSSHYDLYKPNAGEEEFAHDHAQCRRAMGLGRPNRFDPAQILGFVVERYRDEMMRCLHEKGWKPPAGSE